MNPTASPLRLSLAAALALALVACGANEAESPSPRPEREAADPASESGSETASENADDSETPTEPEDLAETGNRAAPPEPEPVVVEAGTRLGPIRVGMTEEAVRSLGLPESEADPRSRRFGPYRVFLEDGAVRRVEARMGELERIRFGDRTFEVGTHIHELRDAFPGCEWYEGGGERYRCADGTLFVQTHHSLDPALYTLAVERR